MCLFYCGIPDLQLHCLRSQLGDFTTLTMSSKAGAPNYYNVRSLKYFSSGVTLELQLPVDMPCTSYSKDIDDIFKISPNVENIKLFYKCSSDIDEHNNHNDSVPCLQGPTKYKAYYVTNMSAHKNFASCSSKEVPVSRTALDLYNKGEFTSLTQVFRQGFEVNYEFSSECTKCIESGGFCGSSNVLDFVCRCKNGASDHVCENYLTVTVSVIMQVLPSSAGVDDRYKTCASTLFSCGNNISNVRYPFWGNGRPQYCGLPHLQLQCLHTKIGDLTTLTVSSKARAPYNVMSLKYFSQNVTLVLGVPNDMNCTAYNKDIDDIFKINSTSVENITLLYKCANDTDEHIKQYGSVLCYQGLRKNSAYYVPNMSAHKNFTSCSSIEVPVSRTALDLYNKGEFTPLTQVFRQGFEVNYEFSSECIKCNKSGGFCGSSNVSDFLCLCKNGASEQVCKNTGNQILFIGIGTGGGVLILAALNIGFCYYLKRRFCSPALLSRDSTISDLETGCFFNGIPVFPFSELKDATNNFDASRELGDGGFGIVYYGKLRDGREVAVKKLYEKNYKQVEQFMNEVEILTRLHHPNLVTLYGCTSRHSRELLLVYEYLSNGTVADHLHGDRVSAALTWEIRMKIALETASALMYLHNSEIVHRDVKTNNILLTDTFAVKVADFGLSRLFPVDLTHVSTAPQGTPGYLDPEYHKCYQVTDKSDVYSFGVVLVELVSSLPAVDISRQDAEINLSDYAMNRLQRGVLHELVDQTLGYNTSFKVQRMITLVAEVAFQCLQHEKDVRPSMTEVHEALVRIEGVDYEALEAEEMGRKRTYVSNYNDVDKTSPSPSSVIDNWAINSSSSNPST